MLLLVGNGLGRWGSLWKMLLLVVLFGGGGLGGAEAVRTVVRLEQMQMIAAHCHKVGCTSTHGCFCFEMRDKL